MRRRAHADYTQYANDNAQKAKDLEAQITKMQAEDTPERRKALREAYPAGERKYHPYKVWLDEIARQTGRKSTPTPNRNKPVPGQLSLME